MISPQFERMRINVSTVFGGFAVLLAAMGGMFANANDKAIERVEAAAEKTVQNVERNTTAIAELTTLVAQTAAMVKQQRDDIRSVKEIADENHDVLIRIQTKLEIETN